MLFSYQANNFIVTGTSSLDIEGARKIKAGFHLPATVHNYMQLTKRKATQDTTVDEWIASQSLLASLARLEDIPLVHSQSNLLRPYQRVGVTFAREAKRSIIADDMGLGKTVQAIIASDQSNISRRLIVCPSHLKHVWKEHLQKWSSVLHHNVEILSNKSVADRRNQIMEYPKENTTLIVGWEQLRLDVNFKGSEITGPLVNWKWDWLLVDEGHRAKDKDTKQSQLFTKLCSISTNVTILTGTPVIVSPADLWPLLHALYPKKFTSYWGFRNVYVDETVNRFGQRQILGGKNTKELQTELAPILIRRLKKDHLKELPAKIETVIKIDMNTKQAKAYKQMAKDMEVDFENHKIYAPLGITQYVRCEQLSFGTSILDESDDSNKIDALLAMIEDETPHKVIVVCNYRKAVSSIAHRLEARGDYTTILGGMDEKSRRDAEYSFVHEKGCRVLIATLKSISEGYTFISKVPEIQSSLMVLTGIPDTAKDYDQVTDRLHRIGQQNSVRIVTLLSKGTVEEEAYDKLGLRGAMVGKLLGRGNSE